MSAADTMVDRLRRDVEEQEAQVRRAREEVSALQEAATEILSVRDSTEVLLTITRTALRLLGADIAGVFLREGDEMVMRSCVGNREPETARLRMTRGQGLAGRVLQTAQPVEVDDYPHTREISGDFIPLAQLESVRSALGAPLTVRGDIIGVLEVWRRRRSVFTAHDVRRLVAMADLVTIAIENARLNDAQVTSMRHLETAYDTLERRVETTRQSAVMQRALIQLLLEGAGLPAIARSVATLTGDRVAILSTTLDPLATHPRDLDVSAVRTELRRVRRDRTQNGAVAPMRMRDGGGWLSVQPIQAAGDSFGYVCLLGDETPGDAEEIVIGQAALVAALHHLEQRAADEARADARDEIIWDLLHGSDEYQRAAARRAERLHIDLRRPHRVFCCQLQDIEVIARQEGLEPARTERARHQLRRILQRVSAQHGGPDLVSLRGNAMVAVAPCADPASARAVAAAAIEQMTAVLPGLVATWGVSRLHTNPLEYGVAYREAAIAMRVAARPGGGGVAVFDELGVTRLLLAPGDQPDLADYVKEVLGPVLDYDRERSTPLIATLRTYLESDCSLNAAAQRLAVHHKTLRYRLNRIGELTRLDLRRHEDRFRADLALRILQVSCPA
ncbi:MAG TPA: helix-turn-helix domain-containing protein [Candidatus Dormibacteraeota bacterium]